MLFDSEIIDQCSAPLSEGEAFVDHRRESHTKSFGLRESYENIAVTDPIVRNLEPVLYSGSSSIGHPVHQRPVFHRLLLYNPISHLIMLDVFRSLKTLLKTSRVQIDNNIFRLHYSITVILLLAFCVIITTKQYVGDPIDCVRSEAIPQSVINTYCWYVFKVIFPSISTNIFPTLASVLLFCNKCCVNQKDSHDLYSAEKFPQRGGRGCCRSWSGHGV